MKRKILVASAFCTALCGCISAPFQPPVGMISQVKAPLSTDGNWKVGVKSGSAAAKCVLGLYAWGDCSITAAAENGGLKRVDYVDYSYDNIIGIWQRATVTVYGE